MDGVLIRDACDEAEHLSCDPRLNAYHITQNELSAIFNSEGQVRKRIGIDVLTMKQIVGKQEMTVEHTAICK